MQIYKRGDVWWARWASDGKKFRKTTKCKDKKAAELVARRWERELADPDYAAANQATIASAAERFLKELKHEGKAKGTINMYECKIGHVVRLLGERRLSDLSHAHVLAFVSQREEETASSHTIHRELTALRRTLKSAARHGEFSRAPGTVLPKYAAGYVPRTRWMTEVELWSVIAHLDPGRGAAVAYALATAADFGSLFRARRSDVSETGVVVRGTKTESRKRTVPRVSLFAPFLSWALEHADGEGERLFRSWSNMRRDIERACERAGVVRFTSNDLRRTAATWLVTRGVPFEVAAKFMGHVSTAMIQKVYGQMDSDDVGRLIEERCAPGVPQQNQTEQQEQGKHR